LLRIAIVGRKASGKTTIAETLLKILTPSYRVITVKHVHSNELRLDAEKTDTWRFAAAGAHASVALSPNRTTMDLSIGFEEIRLEHVLESCLKVLQEADLVLLEGFHSLVARDPGVRKIVATRRLDEAPYVIKGTSAVIAVVTREPAGEPTLLGEEGTPIKVYTHEELPLLAEEISALLNGVLLAGRT